MNKIEIRLLGGVMKFKREIPSSYDEVTGKQFYNYIAFNTGKISFEKFLSKIYRIPRFIFPLLGSFLTYKLSELLEFFSDMRISKNGFIMGKIPGTELLSPEDRLGDVTFFHFMFMDRQFMDYIRTENKDHLYMLAAACYIPLRKDFSKLNFEKHLRKIRKSASETLCMAIFINYTMIRTWLSIVYPFLFPMTEETEEDEKPERETLKSNSHNWMDIFDAFVGDSIPDTEYYKYMPCMDAFRLINKRIKEYHNAKRKV